MPERESDIVAECLIVLWNLGIRAMRQNTGAIKIGKRFITMATKGACDINGWIPGSGRRIEIECKMPGRKLSPDQEKYINMARADGVLAFMVHSAEQLEQRLALECGLAVEPEAVEAVE